MTDSEEPSADTGADSPAAGGDTETATLGTASDDADLQPAERLPEEHAESAAAVTELAPHLEEEPDQTGETEPDGDPEADPPSLTPSVREFFRQARGETCELCRADGTDEGVTLNIHHRVPQAEGGTDHPDNLILVCEECHGRHHGTRSAVEATQEARTRAQPASTDEASGADTDTEAHTDAGADSDATNDAEPLPPRSTANETDGKILSIIEAQGPVPTGVIAEQVGCSKQYARRQCWKLSGEQLIAPTTNDTWELRERADDDQITIGLPDNPTRAKRAGRDETIRRMSAHGLPHTEIAEITGLSRGTIDIAVNRARALRIDDEDDEEVDLTTIAMRVSALLDVIDHAQA